MKKPLLILISLIFFIGIFTGNSDQAKASGVIFVNNEISVIEQWSKAFSHGITDIGYSVQETSDLGYVIVGTTKTSINDPTDIWLIKTDSDGNEEWNKTYGGSDSDSARSIQQTSDGGYIIAGSTWSFAINSEDVWLIKTDSQGNMVWNKTFDMNSDYAVSVKQTTDHGYIVLGKTGENFWLIKTDSNGGPQWNKTFSKETNNLPYEVDTTSDGGYIFVGTFNPSSPPSGGDSIVIKVYPNGTKEWEKVYSGIGNELLFSVDQTSDGGYITAGQMDSSGSGQNDIWLIKSSSNGNHEWNKTFIVPDTLEHYSSVRQTSDGGYIVAGPIKGIIKTDSSGNKTWNVTIESSSLKSIRQISGGGYIVGGYTVEDSNNDFLLVKLNVTSIASDTTPPKTSIIYPLNGSTITTNFTWINATTNESATCNYKMEYECSGCEPAFSEMNNTGGLIHKHHIDSLPNKNYNLTISCQDQALNENNKKIFFYVFVDMNISIISPVNGSTVTENSTWLNATTNENAVCSFKGEGCLTDDPSPPAECDEIVPKNFSATNATFHSHKITDLKGSFTYNLTIACEDNLKNYDNKSIFFYTAFPQPASGGGGGGGVSNPYNLIITINSPINNSIINSNFTDLDFSTDSYAVCKYSLDSGTFNFVDRDVEEEAWKVGTSTKILELSENLKTGVTAVRETIAAIIASSYIDDDQLPVLLVAGSTSNSKGTAPYEQRLYFEDAGTGYVQYLEDRDDVTADFLYFQNNKQIARYELEFTTALESDVEDSLGTQAADGLYLGDFEGVTLEMMLGSYVIASAKRLSSVGNSINLVLLANAVKDTLLEGNTKTYTVNSKDYEITLDFADSDSAKFTINGTATKDMAKGESQTLSDRTTILVADILYQDYAGGIHSATFYLGREKTELRDDDIRDTKSSYELKADDETIDGAYVKIMGSDDNSTFSIDNIEVNMTADDDYYVPADGKLSENPELDEPELLFNKNWDIEYKGLSYEPVNNIKIKTSGTDDYNLEFRDGSGNTATFPIAHAAGGSELKFGDNDNNLIVQENKTITKDDYFIVTDESDTNGKRKSYALRYRGADKVSADNPLIKFDDLGSGERLERLLVSSNSDIAQIKLGGGTFRVYNSSSTSSNDFDILVDLDGKGSIGNNQVTLNSIYGAEINITNISTNIITVKVDTPNPDDVDDLKPTSLIFDISASDGKVNLALNNNQKHSFRTPDDDENNQYAYTSYGAKVQLADTSENVTELIIEYPQSQRVPQVFITGGQTEDKYKKTLNNLEDEDHTIDIICRDSFGKNSTQHLKFTVAANLYVTSNTPKNGSVNISVKDDIITTFNQEINKDFLKKGVIIKDLSGETINGIINVKDGKEVVFNPIMFLKHNTTYIVNLTTDIKSTPGANLKEDYLWNFTTELRDTDNDGIPDHEDNDLDNDGIDDALDAVKGNLSNINTDFKNISFMIGRDSNISKNFSSTERVEIRMGEKKLLEFDFDFSSDIKLDLTNLSILNASNSTTGATIISGLKLPDGFTKTAYMEKVNDGVNGICIKDAEIEWVSDISDSCDATNEFKIECDGTAQNGYTCTYNSSSQLYAVTGLKHSGAKQIEYSKPSDDSGSSDGGSSGGGAGGGGGGGGGSGISYTCNMDWSCSDWSACEAGWETRKCDFVKVAQHSQSEECPTMDNAPAMARKCEVIQELKQEIKGAEESVNDAAETEESKNQITGAVIGSSGNIKNGAIGAAIVFAIVILGTFFYYKFFSRK
ncbi:Ig-like domain-containing protein [Candidatus Woesearchaeota archaeon]|nr:Ig-like domain-containing protein [Candidatus Woesearchaeota archaeon]